MVPEGCMESEATSPEMTFTYYVILTTRNPESLEFKRTMESIQVQTVQPIEVVVIHDKEPKSDFSRIPLLWNRGLRYTYDYLLIMPDDMELEPRYAERILSRMAPKTVIASGDMEPYNSPSPWGGGRFIQQKWFYEQYPNGFPYRMGYETEILCRAAIDRKYAFCYNDIHFKHLRPLGKHHGFSEFGKSMRTMGWYPPFAVLRCLLSYKSKDIGWRGGLKMFYHYVFYVTKSEGYDSKWDKEMLDWNRQATKRELVKYVSSQINHLLKRLVGINEAEERQKLLQKLRGL